MLPSVQSRLSCWCGGQLHKVGGWYGVDRLECDRCGSLVSKEINKKGGREMPFPKDVKRPGDIPEVAILHKIEDFNGKDLMLKGSDVHPNEQYGDGVVLICETENQIEVKILTFSQVIIEQLAALTDHLPLLIRPINNGTYYTIY